MRSRTRAFRAVRWLLLACGVSVASTLWFGVVEVQASGAEAAANAAPSPTAQGMTDPRALEITRTTMSPFCPGRTLDDCPSPYAGEWRGDIRKWVAEGLSTEEIRKRLRGRAAERDLSGAPSTALDSVLPIAVTLGSLLLLGMLLRLLIRPVQRPTNPSASPNRKLPETQKLSDGELDARLDDELKELDD